MDLRDCGDGVVILLKTCFSFALSKKSERREEIISWRQTVMNGGVVVN